MMKTIEEELGNQDNEDIFSNQQAESEEDCESSEYVACGQTSFFMGNLKEQSGIKSPFKYTQ